MPPYTNVGTIGHWRRRGARSLEGQPLSQRGSRRLTSATAFSLIIESYWSSESSSVLAFMITSRPKNSAHLRTPGIFDRCGCQESAATPFSEDTHTPSGVFTHSDWLPSVCPGVKISAQPAPSSTSPSTRTRSSSITWSMPPGTYQAHWVGCTDLNVSTSLRWKTNFALGKNGARGSFSPGIGSVVPIVIRRSCTWRWSKDTKSTSGGLSPTCASACSTVWYSVVSTL